ncbi:5-dehydro-4-deoxy-D-glucuronate isomerase [Gymnodinialimonas mytili]|uniref:5-dehydro-4-deoxy-D-glucuronate isomerase n=1 Tax=Gymnodinialimonas mytili TaxID=3126503 RepID=UPI003F6EA0AD
MDTDGLRDAFHIDGIFVPGQINLTYTHYDRMIVGGAVPQAGAPLILDHVAEAGTPSILERREIGILNIGETAEVSAGNDSHTLGRGDILYLGMGAGPIHFAAPGRFYIISTPAHRSLPSRLVSLEEAESLSLGSAETANDRTIYMFIHPEVMESCQLVMGYTMFHGGSVWNTMPAHLHDRRMEAYLYFDLAEDNRVFHFMGKPQETRHIVMRNEEAVVSPPWSIHCGAGTGSYTFCWAMAGDNVDYKDVEMVAMEDLR